MTYGCGCKQSLELREQLAPALCRLDDPFREQETRKSAELCFSIFVPIRCARSKPFMASRCPAKTRTNRNVVQVALTSSLPLL